MPDLTNTAEYSVAADTSVEDWIDGTSYLQASVTIYRNPGMWARYEPLLAELTRLETELDQATPDDEDSPAVTDATLSDKPTVDPHVAELRKELDAKYAEAEELYNSFVNDKEVWRLRKLEQHELEMIRAELVEELGDVPEKPKKLPNNATKLRRERHEQDMKEWMTAIMTRAHEINLRSLALVTLDVVVKGDTKPAPSLDGLRRLVTRPHGAEHFTALVNAMEQLTIENVEIVAPHRPGA